MTVKLKNLSKDIIVLDDIEIADKFISRLKGLLGKDNLREGQGLKIEPCSSIHTMGMKFPIDVVFVNKDHKIVHIIKDMKPYRLSPIIPKSFYVIETFGGTISNENLEIGDLIGLTK